MSGSEVWYPSREDFVGCHEDGLKIAGAHPAARKLRRSLNGFDALVEKMKLIDGIYAQTAYLLWKATTLHFFNDGNHRAGFLVTMLFLRMNDLPSEIPRDVVVPFIKWIRSYTLTEIEEWIRSEAKRPC